VTTASAVVFGYSDIGVRGLRALLAGDVDVRCVVTHADDPGEHRWFASVADTAREYDLPSLAPERVDDEALLEHVRGLAPDFLFSFYYRQLLPDALLAMARRGALNVHGSLLPKYRGRAPVNWAVLRGEEETGATLHYMVARADAGDIVDQQAVPILPDDTAYEVAGKVTVAAEMVIVRTLPALITGTAPRRPQPIEPGQYFGRRRPEDGRIDWRRPAREVHDLVRAVAPPFPGAYTDVDGQRWWIHRTRRVALQSFQVGRPRMIGRAGRCYAVCGDGGVLELRVVADAHGERDLATLALELERSPIEL
jgi:methionyl-tRNA formyltransferase